ncbi:MAG: DUF1385 domain-containing protein [Myxococcota bacterium]
METKLNIGGQAVIEGVMMRTPKAFCVAVRRANGTIAVREERWRSLWERFKFLRFPFFRGGIVLLEALFNGLSALAFSANEASREPTTTEETKPEAKDSFEPPLSNLTIGFTIALSLVLGVVIFVAIPHFLTWGLGYSTGNNLDVDSFWFHLIDGVIKIAIFILYIRAISFMPDIKRVFMYHGAEHKAIYSFEKGEPLTVENARKNSRFHPRCGTSFIINVLLISILIFSVVFPFVPKLSEITLVNQLINIGFKIALLFPVAGISYEFIRYAGNHIESPLISLLIKPGLWMQKLTTYEPMDDQLEIALVSIITALNRQKDADSPTPSPNIPLRVITSLDEIEFLQ